VMFTTPDDDDVDDDEVLLPEDAGGPPQAAMASAADAASAPGSAYLALRRATPPGEAVGIRREACIFLITRCSLFHCVCIKCLPRGSDRTRAAPAAAPCFP